MGQSLVKGPPTLAHGRARSKRKSRVGFRAGPVLPQSPPVAFSSAGWRVIKLTGLPLVLIGSSARRRGFAGELAEHRTLRQVAADR